MKKNAGFTMIELLAVVVILGLLLAVAIPTTMNILNDSRNNTYVEDAIRLSSRMDYQMRSDNKMPVPARGACIAMNLVYLDDNTFNDAPYDGEYHRLGSFVVARRADTGNGYDYYVRLVENLIGATGYRGVDLANVDNLYNEGAKDFYVKDVASSKVFSLTDYILDVDFVKTQLSSYDIDCREIIIYAPDDSQ